MSEHSGGSARRPYDSPVRRAQAAQTRERIVASGAELLHGFPVWNWRALTARAVAARAGVNERTVYRYFPTERDLRDAVLERMQAEAGVDLEGLSVERVQEVATRIFEYVSNFPLEPRTPRDPTVAAANARQRDALLGAVTAAAGDWPTADRVVAAALLDVLWSPTSYERLVGDWGIEPKDAIAAITWAIGLIQASLGQAAPRPALDPLGI